MKKILLIMFSCLFILGLTGCDRVKEVVERSGTNNNSVSGLANPMVAYDSLDVINDKTGVEIVSPNVVGIDDEAYYIVDDRIAQYNFELDGNKFTIRGAYIIDEDISGIYDEENNSFDSGFNFSVCTDTYYLDRFFDNDGRQYTISVSEPKNLDEDEFLSICIELEESMRWHSNDPLIGEYQDMISERATCSVERNSNKKYSIYINWSNSANEYSLWTIKAKLDGDRLVYSKEEIETYDYSKDDPLISEDIVQYDGYFEIKDEKLYWLGASQENQKSCIFEKVNY